MPRKPKPAAYTNRSDLQGTQPVNVPKGQPYGKRQQLEQSQQAAPLPRMDAQAMMEAATNYVPPSSLRLDAPTSRPDEPLTAGSASGPGPGPEALNLPTRPDGDPDIEALAPYLPQLEFMASQPTSTEALRQFVRRVRGALPPET